MSQAKSATAAGLSPASPYQHERGNVLRLAVAQALAGANSVVVYATGAIVGHTLAPSPALATLPISIFVVGMAACTLPAGLIAQRHGRRAAFLTGTGCGVLVGLLAALAVVLGSFWLFCVATFFGGVYAAVVLSFRFAAADCAPPERRARALSAVMAGGVFAGVLGPQLVTFTMHLWLPHLFAATYLAQAAVAALSAVILLGVRLPRPTAAETARGRPLGVIARQPRFITAVICGVVSYLLMNFLMTAAPLAMQMCGLPQEASNLGLQWHVIAMYGPSFFTGRLITRFGAPRVVTAGLMLIAASAAVGLTGVDVAHFWLTLILLGLGWNFGFVGASALVLECHRPEERARVQSFNDFVVFGTMAFGSFLSGGLLASYGWDTVLWLSFVPLVVAIVALTVAAASRPSQAAG
ncbi:MFS transporter [Pseudoroseomonas wenyumeiae]|uniref:MFS transporter n=1 Tax=Teichococcus wenyumeiae TaxID=2478470 RepID=A0A3A9JDV9_9PROT|nr:MFS transporter [Pseudoroseomonas wenyumeiae]RKK04400.1 MFS transporter [Pseudoroseomonas wenyumeiae]RMI19320.1 MFS transporter [Pseudoroseomonas wenyumeiae]